MLRYSRFNYPSEVQRCRDVEMSRCRDAETSFYESQLSSTSYIGNNNTENNIELRNAGGCRLPLNLLTAKDKARRGLKNQVPKCRSAEVPKPASMNLNFPVPAI